MSRRALIEHRPWLLAGIVAALAFYLLDGGNIGGLYLIAIKGAAVGALAIYALVRGDGTDAKLLALYLGLSALGDMVLELYFNAGGAFFFAAQLAAIGLYLRNRREHPTGSQKAAGTGLLIGTPIIAWLLTQDSATALYALALGGMAAGAWLSRFPRYRVGIGAVLFVISDLLIFAGMGGRIDPDITAWLVWPIYFVGQFLITVGVIQALRRQERVTEKLTRNDQ
jgi:uncharacterized membrane protein YhhN